jgi:hypothetical protein
LSPGLLLAGFFSEPQQNLEQRMFAALGIFSIAIGTLLHALAQLPSTRKSP